MKHLFPHWTGQAQENLTSWLPGIFFGGLLYGLTIAFAPPTASYNDTVTQFLYMASAWLFCWQGSQQATRWSWNRSVMLALVLVAACILKSIFDSPQQLAAWHRLGLYSAVSLWGFGIYVLHRDGQRGDARSYILSAGLVHALILATIIAWVYAILDGHYNGRTLLPYHSHFRHPSYLGFVCAASGLGLALISPRLQLTAWLLTAVALLEIIALGTRGAFYAWIFSALILISMGKGRRRLLIICCISSLVAAGTISHLLESNHLFSAGSLFTRTHEGGESLYQTSGRWAMWQDAIRGIAHRPWFGYGPEAYLTSHCCMGSTEYPGTAVQPHSSVLLWLLEFGWVGTLLLANLAWAIVKSTAGSHFDWAKKLTSDPELLTLTSTLVGFLAYSLIDGLFYHAIPLVLFSTLAGLWIARIHQLAVSK